MAYFGYIKTLRKHLMDMRWPPAVLEVGVDRGITFLPLLTTLAARDDGFFLVGVDVLVQEHVRLIVEHMGPYGAHGVVKLIEENSLETLPKLAATRCKFDVILLDGDHNYHTVSNELESLDALLKPGGAAVIDDYDGRWSENDMWYSQRDGYVDNENASKSIATEKHGVKAAVDDFLAKANGAWQKHKPLPGEPVVLARTAELTRRASHRTNIPW